MTDWLMRCSWRPVPACISQLRHPLLTPRSGNRSVRGARAVRRGPARPARSRRRKRRDRPGSRRSRLGRCRGDVGLDHANDETRSGVGLGDQTLEGADLNPIDGDGETRGADWGSGFIQVFAARSTSTACRGASTATTTLSAARRVMMPFTCLDRICLPGRSGSRWAGYPEHEGRGDRTGLDLRRATALKPDGAPGPARR